MNNTSNLFTIEAGTSQSRLTESEDPDAPLYYYYTIDCINSDLEGAPDERDPSERRQIRTMDDVKTVRGGDLILSLNTMTASFVSKEHDGYLLTLNFARIVPKKQLSPAFLLFLFNEDGRIRRQMMGDSIVDLKKTSVKQLSNIEFKYLPDMYTQESIGKTYLNQKHISYLRRHVLELEDEYVLGCLKRSIKNHHK